MFLSVNIIFIACCAGVVSFTEDTCWSSTCETPNVEKCWGYESGCTPEKWIYDEIQCDGAHQPPLSGKTERFWYDADFGYVKKYREMQTICAPELSGNSASPDVGQSELRCDAHMRICHATNLYADFSNLRIAHSAGSYREDVFDEGQIGGHCQYHENLHDRDSEHKGPVWSWISELQSYRSLDFRPFKRDGSPDRSHCDLVETRPVVFMKLDVTVNMYHHFCDFFNLYASQHVNGSFTDDILIVVWDTRMVRCVDSLFGATWSAFTRHERKMIADYDGKRVCFRDVMFALLPRMRLGLYYSSFITPGCRNSGLFKAFNRHILARLGIKQQRVSSDGLLRVTLLVRGTTYRRILNEDELVDAMRSDGSYDVSVVNYNYSIPFLQQLSVTQNSDIFVGIHGAGLTHLLFLPDWATVFDLFHCHDRRCYYDLSRLRGVDYVTWEDEEKLEMVDINREYGGGYAKFSNYRFNVEEFMRLLKEAEAGVRRKLQLYNFSHINDAR
ncbi:EGF domain-specific O-linked N-acetylglucosamine transferase-like [Corticium candelabrum]|uniref:EGF domain-specific O-linked N-acetylglucosamine transferase-like n=1 Tax=Corticium candelabrum TaxID=121492 RepID=UPI002E25E54E|nr:EGF domain-specific O-linked N-acetylglucosamine transferase-like [Corticium candelabrum]